MRIFKDEVLYASARRWLDDFAVTVNPALTLKPFHKTYYRVLEEFAKGKIKKLIVTMPPQHGKLLPIETPVLTTDGWVRHGDLKVGDYVFGHDGKPKVVLGNSGEYYWNVTKVNFASNVSIEASNEHLWKVKSDYDNHKGRVEEIKETKEIFNRKNRRSPYIDISPSLETEQKELPIDPYVLGCWLGDGTSRIGYVSVGEQDIEHFKQLGKHKEVRPRNYRILVEGLSKLLRINNLIQNKHIPTEYLLASKSQRLELLKGLMDTDGCVDKRGNCEFTQMKGRLADDVYVLLRTLGIKARISDYQAKLNDKVVGVKTRVLFNPDKGQPIFKLKRKQQRIDNKNTADRDDKKKFFIQSISGSKRTLGNCISVEGGMYLAGKDLIPTHNSEGCSRVMPAFILGRNPDAKLAIASYSAPFARKFNRSVQRIISDDRYHQMFPKTNINRSNAVNVTGSWLRNADEFEVIDKLGGLKTVGRGGALTGTTVDKMIMDDLLKDYAEANSPIIRQAAWDWYLTVVKTRLHNDSQELMTFTRWHEKDPIGMVEETEEVIDLHSMSQLNEIKRGAWIKVNFEAIKESDPTEIDPRKPGEPLWEEKHSLEKLLAQKAIDEDKFNCLYQGNPTSQKGLLYKPFVTYTTIPDAVIKKGNYTDTADEGDDFLCSICYDVVRVGNEKMKYVTDVLFTQEPIEETTVTTPMMINRNRTREAKIESNNGGKAFAMIVKGNVLGCEVSWFHQSKNKESRILTNAGEVNRTILFPIDWKDRWPRFYDHVTKYKRMYSSNKYHDGVDVLTGIVETDGLGSDYSVFA